IRVYALIVSNENSTQQLLAAILAERGHEVKVCSTAAEALAAHRQVGPCLLLVDGVHPRADALRLCRKVRKRPMGERNVIVAVLSAERAQDAEQVLKAGADDCFCGPLDPSLLQARLALAEQRFRDSAERSNLQAMVRWLPSTQYGVTRVLSD